MARMMRTHVPGIYRCGSLFFVAVTFGGQQGWRTFGSMAEAVAAQQATKAELLHGRYPVMSRPLESVASLDVAGAARHIGCSERQIFDLVRRQTVTGFPFHKSAGRLLFKSAELARWVVGS